jgi:hypothetical protein
MTETPEDIMKRMRADLEARGVLSPNSPTVERNGYGIRRSALAAYKERHGVEYALAEREVIIEDV